MRKITKALGVAAAAGVLLATSVMPASADTINSTVSGSNLTASTSGATLTGVTLNGTGTQTATGAASEVWTVTDARGTVQPGPSRQVQPHPPAQLAALKRRPAPCRSAT